MDKVAQIKLVKTEYTRGSYGQNVATEVERSLFCNITSVSSAEFFRAGAEGLRPSYVFLVWPYEYEGEEELVYKNKRYSIYRTFENKNGRLELYTNLKV